MLKSRSLPARKFKSVVFPLPLNKNFFNFFAFYKIYLPEGPIIIIKIFYLKNKNFIVTKDSSKMSR